MKRPKKSPVYSPLLKHLMENVRKSKSYKHVNLKVSKLTEPRHTVWCVNNKIAHEKAKNQIGYNVTALRWPGFENINSLAENEFTLKTKHHVYRHTRLLQNYCCALGVIN